MSATRPSVVVIATTFPAHPGDGTPEFVLTLSRSVPRYDVTVVAPRMPGAPDDEVIDGVRVRRVPYFPRRWEGLAADAIMPTLRAERWRIIEVPFLVGAMLFAAWREVRRHRAAVVNPHWILPAGLIALVLRALCRVPYVVTVHGADAYTLRSGVGAWLKRRVLRNAAAVLPVSNDIARTLGIEDAPVLRMGVDTAAVRAAVERRPEDGLLVYIGRLADKKGVDVLLDAVARLDGARLEILGDGPDRGALETKAARLGLDERVRFLGRQPASEVLAALARAQVVVIPSRMGSGGDMEGTPVVLCEAMAAGVPVVASDLGGLGECIVDGTTGLLVPPDDAVALAVTLEKALTEAFDVAALGRGAADEASRTLDIGAIGAEYARVFDDVAQGR
jgi:glycosyltransferase involved in cell wall biosynthesis